MRLGFYAALLVSLRWLSKIIPVVNHSARAYELMEFICPVVVRHNISKGGRPY